MSGLRIATLLPALLVLLPVTAAAPVDADWSTFTDRIDACRPSGVCTTTDSLRVLRVASEHPVDIRIDTGNTGFCGEAGARTTLTVPPDATTLTVSAEASKDFWGQGPGIKIEDSFVHRFSGDNPHRERWPPDNHTIDVSRYAGETVELRVVVEDTSQRWCDMGDHDAAIAVDGMWFDAGTARSVTAPDADGTTTTEPPQDPETGGDTAPGALDRVITAVTPGTGDVPLPVSTLIVALGLILP